MNSCQVRSWLIRATAATLTLGGCAKKAPEPSEPVPAAKPSASSTQNQSMSTVKDVDIDHAVQLELAGGHGLDAKRIGVKTTNGNVELAGSVSDLLAKRRAAMAAETVRGVRQVSDHLVLDSPSRPDADLQKDVDSSLSATAGTVSLAIRVAAKAGAVTLKGNVKSWRQRQLAERTAEGVRGVHEVDNQLVVDPGATRTDSDIQKDVASRIRWDRLVEDGLLGVGVKDGKTTLKGVVRSAAERRRAAQLAWVNGVKAVDSVGVAVDWSAKEVDVRKNKAAKVTDAELAQAVRDAAALDPWLANAKLDVSAASGNVTLRGSVESLRGKTAAETLARNALGTSDVSDLLAVKPPSSIADAAIEAHVSDVLRDDPVLTSFAVGVASKGGNLSLTGTVKTSFERAQAIALASGVLGVTRIDDQLKLERPEIAYVYDWYLAPYEPYVANFHYAPVTPTRSDADIGKQIQGELTSSPFVDANAIKVAVVAGKATLSGAVGSFRDKREAEQNAFEGGAIAVENRLSVRPSGG